MEIRKTAELTAANPRGTVPTPAETPREPRDTVSLGQRPVAPELQSLLAATADEAKSLESKLGPHRPGEVLVKLKGKLTKSTEQAFLDKFGAELLYRFDIPRDIYRRFDGELLHLKLPPGMTVAQAMAAMSKDPRVAYAVPNDEYQLLGSAEPVFPDDLDPRLWGLHNTGQDGGKEDADIDAPEAWAVHTGRADGPVIAVIDTGADYNHPDLAENIWTNPNEVADGTDTDGNGVVDDIHGYNALEQTGDPMDGFGHGSHVSGTIAGRGNNGQGVVGVNWRARVMPVKIFSDEGRTDAASIVRGILYATRMGARITSNSWGGSSPNEAIRDAFAASGALHVIAAGNEGSDNDVNPTYPASYDLDNIIAVAATDRNDQLAGFSNYGAKSVDVAAPGVDILSTVPGGKYASYSGTSMATPHVSGVAALIASAYPDATNEQIKTRILAGADRLPQLEGRILTGGRLNAAKALENDTVAPGAPNDFQPREVSSRGVTLRWTATGDDGWEGTPAFYELRMADRPIVDGEPGEGEIRFSDAAKVATGRPGPTGTWERAEVEVIPSGQERRLYFALKVYDNVGNASEMRTTEATIPPAALAFEDDMDGGTGNWTPDEGWARVEAPDRGLVWTDSPDGPYGNNADTSLTSRPIDLSGFTNSTLIFDSRYDLENRYDKVHLEASTDGGQTWTELESYTGSSGWATRTVDLSAYDGQQVQIRFRLTSDGSITRDGFYLDRVVIAGDRAGS